MESSGMLHLVALVGTDVSEELSASIIRVTRMGELGTILRSVSRLLVTTNVPSSPILVGGATFLRNVGSYKSHTA
jgi:hypothetical protein